ncbi:hypothetical protein SPURM210S_04923 [Streptomyces purpurascens]
MALPAVRFRPDGLHGAAPAPRGAACGLSHGVKKLKVVPEKPSCLDRRRGLRTEVRNMAATDPKATHGMLVVGEETAYLSHLPMFMRPHDFQVLLEATFTNDAGDAQQVYVDDRRTTGTAVYTPRPERFVLTELVGEDGQPARTSFTGTLFRGHFERGGTEILDPVTVDVRHVVHFRRFDRHAVRPTDLTTWPSARLTSDSSRTSSPCPRTSTTSLRCGRSPVPRVPNSPTKCCGKGRLSRSPRGPTARTADCERVTRSRRASSARGRPEATCGSSRGGSSTSRKGAGSRGALTPKPGVTT